MTEETVSMLLTSPHLGNLKELVVRKSRNGLSREVTERLQHRFGRRFLPFAF
jgi:hypothetical protein